MTDALAINLEAPCWLFQGALNNGGYKSVQFRGKRWMAHRMMWTVMRGEIPEGMDIDHLCRVRSCGNPQHMEVVTRSENLRRGISANGIKTHCSRGHPYDETNTRSYKGGRVCRACQKASELTRPPRRHIRTGAV